MRAMFDLAMHYGEGPISIKTVAERQDLSEHYLEQLIAALKKAGLVNSVRGAQGGYELALPPEQIKIGDIIRALEGPIAPVECVESDDPDARNCERYEGCAARVLWRKLRDSMIHVLDSTSLRDLCDEAVNLQSERALMYNI